MPEVLAPGEPGAQDGSEAGTASESGMRSSLLSYPLNPGQEADRSLCSILPLRSPRILSLLSRLARIHVAPAGKDLWMGKLSLQEGQEGTKSSKIWCEAEEWGIWNV